MGPRIAAGTALLAVAALVAPGVTAAAVKPYVKPVGDAYTLKALLSVGERVPETSNPSAQYQMVGIPDGLGARRSGDGKVDLWMNHELGGSVVSEPRVGGPLNRGAFVSHYRLLGDGSVVSGERAYDTVFRQNTRVGPAADSTNSTPGFGRFCSGFLADQRVGFDRPIYLTNEESGGASSFDGRGGQSVAIFDGELHTLPRLGHFNKENTVVVPDTGRRTVILSFEDGPTTPDSQLYMYVGWKNRSARTVLGRNGLDNGRLYVLAADGQTNESDFRSGSARTHWVEVPDAEYLSETELEAAADEAGAFGFVRIEDGAVSPHDPRTAYFVTTGEGAGINELGRVYRLRLGDDDPRRPGQLTVVQNADAIVGAGGDTAVSPDNVDLSRRYLMVLEDGTASSRPVMGSKGRDGSIWRFNLDGFQRERVAQLDPPGRDGIAVGPGQWETSGIIDVGGLFGADSWVFDVQAHSPTTAPAPNTVEDGQLLLMRRANG